MEKEVKIVEALARGGYLVALPAEEMKELEELIAAILLDK